ncbi:MULTISPECIES: ABC transporter substrate-binding protein [unclassified Pseudodesulfovibrio]|uniref:ABC transporter substrate-binding protein n=1 Tax=unclassified Pseudodesulfovibrio TaxID=2661612 RepID=UPI000FEC0F42|nr:MULTISPECIES: ABC transporter substrate-binding protein [unclassified Pseudodesulfovibrio]MCJ2164719.1 ABC transporter substrate-binding protein [Pseudodesulfovibrio sp. S3-i]RWU04092.1 ABC transporter substrate-binding protein [Pseudodesulfovibrio sp. S3]
MKKKLLISFVVMASLMLGASFAMARDLTLGLKGEPTSLDPHFHNVTSNNENSLFIFDRLVNQDYRQKLEPGLAESWTPVNDTTWEFKLRKGVTFHDGSPFTAEDVKFTIERIPNVPNSPSSFTFAVSAITEVEIIDPHTIRVHSEKPSPLMPRNFAAFNIVSKKAAEGMTTEDFNSGKAAIGTGPYKLVEWARGDKIVYERNENYWGKKLPWEKIIVRPISNDGTRVAALKSGDVDLINFVPPADMKHLEKAEGVTLSKSSSTRLIYLHLDSDRDDTPMVTDNDGNKIKNPMKDVRVRKAISKAINREAIASRIMDGLAIPAAQMLPDGYEGTSPNLKPEKYDPAGAKALLAEAGYPDGFRITIHGPNDRYVNDGDIAQAIAQMLTKVGIKTEVNTMPKAVYFGKASALEFSLMLVGWATDTGEHSNCIGSLLHTYDKEKGYGASNRGRYSNPVVDQKMEEALVTVDMEKHNKLLIEAVEIGMGDVGIVPIHYQVNVWGTKKGLSYHGRTDGYTLPYEIQGE